MLRVQEIARTYRLRVEWGNSVHLLRGKTGIASIHDTGLENDLCVNPNFKRGRDLLCDLARELFGSSPAGPVEWRVISRSGEDSRPGRARHGIPIRAGEEH